MLKQTKNLVEFIVYQVEHTVRVSSQLGHLCERRIFPHQDLVL